jgi:hypothetical protein
MEAQRQHQQSSTPKRKLLSREWKYVRSNFKRKKERKTEKKRKEINKEKWESSKRRDTIVLNQKSNLITKPPHQSTRTTAMNESSVFW